MPGITQEQKVAAVANLMISATAQLATLNATISTISSAWTNLGAANKLNAFPTAALTTTGGLGAADGSPNVANPINTGVTIGNEIVVAISANSLAGLLTYLQGVQSAMNGSAVSANGAAAQLVALCL